MVFIAFSSKILDFCLKLWYHGGNRVRLPATSEQGL
nr:MAG TPA: hypothetical protein [Caudoviricetes sp.]